MWNEYTSIIISSVVVYLFIVIAIRIFGKKEIAQLSVIDLVFILLISNSVQNAMVGGNTTLEGGLVAAGSLFVVNFALKNIIYRSKKAGEILQGHALMLVYEGKIMEKNLQKSRISMDELDSAVREHGVNSVKDVNLAVLEVDGNISVLSDNFKQRTVRKRKAHKMISRQMN
jgi:uncharacterized membrane protein YcaP (DUF421 family)